MTEQAPWERSTVLAPCPLPAIDDAMRAKARDIPGQLLVFEDPAAPTDRPLPKFAIQGGYEVNEAGELTGRYKINPLYGRRNRSPVSTLNTAEAGTANFPDLSTSDLITDRPQHPCTNARRPGERSRRARRSRTWTVALRPSRWPVATRPQCDPARTARR